MNTTTIYLIAFALLAIIIAAVLYFGIKQINALLKDKDSNSFMKPTIRNKHLQQHH